MLTVRLTQNVAQEVKQAAVIQMVKQAVTDQLEGLFQNTAFEDVSDVSIFTNEQVAQLLHSEHQGLRLLCKFLLQVFTASMTACYDWCGHESQALQKDL